MGSSQREDDRSSAEGAPHTPSPPARASTPSQRGEATETALAQGIDGSGLSTAQSCRRRQARARWGSRTTLVTAVTALAATLAVFTSSPRLATTTSTATAAFEQQGVGESAGVSGSNPEAVQRRGRRRQLGFLSTLYSAFAPGAAETGNAGIQQLTGGGVLHDRDPLDDYANEIQRMNEILAGNDQWINLLSSSARKHMKTYATKLNDMPQADTHIPMNHVAPPAITALFKEYYPKIGVAGLMFAPHIYYHADLQLFGHNIGMVVAEAVNETSLPPTLQVLGTHTTDWRAAIHGVVWGYIHKSHFASTDEQWKFVRSEKACGYFLERNTYFYTSCLHGFGHGLYQVYKDDLDSAIEVCSHVKDQHDGEDASQCATGVYMEYAAGVTHYPLTNEICTGSQFPRACWLRAWVARTPAMKNMGDKDLCSDVVGETAHADCVYGLGKAAFGIFQQQGKSMDDLCKRYRGQAAVMCVYGCTSMLARTIEGAAAPEARASAQRMRAREMWCRTIFGVRNSDEFDPTNLNHMKTKACVVGVRSLHSLEDMRNIAWDATSVVSW